uniref:CRAL-TRIO domain-containing protein n=1 Tax=Calcidiscus leptoporus TaxID=127549 RepID=A0A7S0IL42_9EUKA
MTNVSKAFRRLDAYASWMEDAAEELTQPPLTTEEVLPLVRAWALRTSHDSQGRLVWWLDIAQMQLEAIAQMPISEQLRGFVWFAHAIMFDERAQRHGMAIVENLACVGFWAAVTMVPMKLSVKLDRLTIGILPVKMKLILMLDTPRWMSVMMRIFSMFMSKKMQKRMVMCKKEWHAVGERLGADCVPSGFGECGGTLHADPVLDAHF